MAVTSVQKYLMFNAFQEGYFKVVIILRFLSFRKLYLI